LDTTTRRLSLGGENEVLLSDTVGFIRKLPHHLVASFRATLREVQSADLLLHVIDVCHPARQHQIAAVDEVLEELLDHPVHRMIVLNKADLLQGETAELEARAAFPDGILVSALRPKDCERLRQSIASTVRELRVLVRVECPATRQQELRGLVRRGERRAEGYFEDRVWSEWWLDRRDLGKLRRAGFRVDATDPARAAGANEMGSNGAGSNEGGAGEAAT
jgi:GTPase